MEKSNNGLNKSEMKYFHLINSILDVILELNLDLTIKYVNPQVYDIFGYSPEEIIGERSINFVHPDDITRTLNAIKRTIKTRDIISTELKIRHKKGHYIPISAIGRMVKHNHQDKIVAVLRDISIASWVSEDKA